MWNQLESYKNHYLQWCLPHLGSETINYLVTRDFEKSQLKRDRCRTPMKFECQPSTYFDDRANLAYGWFAIPKLVKEIGSDDAKTRWRALTTLSEFLLNPLQAQRAILEFNIVRKAQNLFLRLRHNFIVPKYNEIARLLKIFYILSNYLNGAEKISVHKYLINELYKIILDREEHMEIAAKIMRNLTEKPEVCLYLLDNTPVLDRLIEIFRNDNCVPYYPDALWIHLSHCLEIAPARAIEKGFFELLHRRVLCKLPFYNNLNMKCFALLLRCKEGQDRFDEVDGIVLLHVVLTTPGLDTYEYVVQALMNGLVSKRSLWQACIFTCLPDLLVNLAKDTKNQYQQLYCLQALRNLGQMPSIKRYIAAVCLEDIEEMTCCDEVNECTRDDLAVWLRREIYDTTE